MVVGVSCEDKLYVYLALPQLCSRSKDLTIPPFIVGALLVIVTLFTRYRDHQGGLITVIRRDGILYFVVAFGE